MKNIIIVILIVVVLILGLFISFILNPHSVQWYVAALFHLGLVIFAYSKGKNNKLNISFSLFGLTIYFWVIGVYGLYIAPNQNFAKYWGTIFSIGMILLPLSFFQFTIYLINIERQKVKLLLWVFYLVTIVFLLLNYSGILLPEWHKFEWKYTAQPTVFYKLFLLYFTCTCAYGLFLIFRAFRKTKVEKEKNQLGYVLLAYGIGLFFGLLNSSLSFGMKLYPLGGIGTIFVTSVVAYAIVQHQLMDIKVVIRKGMIYSTLTLSVVGIYALVVAVFVGLFGASQLTTTNNWFINAVAGLIVAMVILPMRERVQSTIDVLFFKERYNFRKVLSKFSSELTSVMELTRLLHLLIETVLEVMHINKGCVALKTGEKKEFQVKSFKGLFASGDIKGYVFPETDYMVERLEKEKKLINITGSDNENFSKLKEFGFSLCIPLISKEELVGIFLLGDKLSEDAYSGDDVELLTAVANQAAIAIVNAKLYEAQIEMEKNLSQTDKMVALGTLASSIMHEVKTPLQLIKTYVQSFPKKYQNPDYIERFNNLLPKEIERMENVVSELLHYSRQSIVPDVSEVNIENLVDSVLALMNEKINSQNISVVKKFETVPRVPANCDQLRQAFINLILNAIQAMTDGGSLCISTDIVSKDREIYAGIKFEDTGCGIPKENLDSLFRPFFTTKTKGTGLGLSITNKIVKEHFGRIEVKSPPDGKDCGSSFHVLLPIARNKQRNDNCAKNK